MSDRKQLLGVLALLPRQEQLRLVSMKDALMLIELEKKMALLTLAPSVSVVKAAPKAKTAEDLRAERNARQEQGAKVRRARLMDEWQLSVTEALRSKMYLDKPIVQPLSEANQWPYLWAQGMPKCPCPPWMTIRYYPLAQQLALSDERGHALRGRSVMLPPRPHHEWWDPRDLNSPRDEDGRPIFHEDTPCLVEALEDLGCKGNSKGDAQTPTGARKVRVRGMSIADGRPVWETWGEQFCPKDADGVVVWDMNKKFSHHIAGIPAVAPKELKKAEAKALSSWKAELIHVQGIEVPTRTKVPGEAKLGDKVALNKALLTKAGELRAQRKAEKRQAKLMAELRNMELIDSMNKQPVMWAQEPSAAWLKSQGFPVCPELSAQPWINVHVCCSRGPDGKTQCRYPEGSKAVMVKAPDMRVK